MAFHLRLPRALYDEMLTQARLELPNECCGLLAGKRDAEAPSSSPPTIAVTRRYPLINAAASATEYLSEPRSMFEAHRAMRREGLEIVAVYHSHPTSPPIPSRKDRERSYSEDVINFIISLQGDRPEMRGWWLTASDHREASWEVVD